MAVLVAIAGCAGCGEDTASPPTSTSTTADTATVATDPPQTSAPTTSTTVAPSGDEAEVRAVIDRYWDAWFAATANPPDPDNAELNAVLTGDAKMRIVGGVERWKNDAQYVRIPEGSIYERSIKSVTFDDAGIATVVQCVVDDTELVSAVTGEVIDSNLSTLVLTTTLARYPDGWRITTSNATQTIEGQAACHGD